MVKNPSPTLKKFGHRFLHNLHFLRYPLPNYPGLFKDMGKTEVRRKGGWVALAHTSDYKSLDYVSASNAQPFPLI